MSRRLGEEEEEKEEDEKEGEGEDEQEEEEVFGEEEEKGEVQGGREREGRGGWGRKRGLVPPLVRSQPSGVAGGGSAVLMVLLEGWRKWKKRENEEAGGPSAVRTCNHRLNASWKSRSVSRKCREATASGGPAVTGFTHQRKCQA